MGLNWTPRTHTHTYMNDEIELATSYAFSNQLRCVRPENYILDVYNVSANRILPIWCNYLIKMLLRERVRERDQRAGDMNATWHFVWLQSVGRELIFFSLCFLLAPLISFVNYRHTLFSTHSRSKHTHTRTQIHTSYFIFENEAIEIKLMKFIKFMRCSKQLQWIPLWLLLLSLLSKC